MTDEEIKQLTQESINEYIKARDEHCGEAECYPAMEAAVRYVLATADKAKPESLQLKAAHKALSAIGELAFQMVDVLHHTEHSNIGAILDWCKKEKNGEIRVCETHAFDNDGYCQLCGAKS